MKQYGEPSVEEILASIKQVIARDNRAFAQASASNASASSDATCCRSTAAAAPEADDVLDLAESDLVDTNPAEDTLTAKQAGIDPALLTENTRSAMRDSLAALAAISGPGAVPQIVRSGETSLEGMVRDLLRPALSEWLDTNLPPLVERMVAAEIAKIVGKKG